MNFDFAGRLNKPELILKEFKYWVIILKESVNTLGSSVIILKSNKESFGDVSSEEMAEFSLVCKWFEDKTKTLFGAEKWNYCAMMMKENFVHFQVLPRYSHEVNMYGIKWIDEDWPKKPQFNKIEVSYETLLNMKNDFIKSNE